ncbi:MAG TPA: hypothetical protein PLR95_07680, partial [Paludibacteraceae bacterium]|nr:hypothetical protein [Paludibacteraceae bacterium]
DCEEYDEYYDFGDDFWVNFDNGSGDYYLAYSGNLTPIEIEDWGIKLLCIGGGEGWYELRVDFDGSLVFRVDIYITGSCESCDYYDDQCQDFVN